MKDTIDKAIENAFGRICPRCGAVMEIRKGVLRYKDEKIDYDYWKCGYCGYREDC